MTIVVLTIISTSAFAAFALFMARGSIQLTLQNTVTLTLNNNGIGLTLQ